MERRHRCPAKWRRVERDNSRWTPLSARSFAECKVPPDGEACQLPNPPGRSLGLGAEHRSNNEKPLSLGVLAGYRHRRAMAVCRFPVRDPLSPNAIGAFKKLAGGCPPVLDNHHDAGIESSL